MNVQENLLVTLMEECAEVAKAASKILRAGPDAAPPGRLTTNLQELQGELQDLYGTLAELDANYLDINFRDSQAINAKRVKLRHFIAVSRELGFVQGPLAYKEGRSSKVLAPEHSTTAKRPHHNPCLIPQPEPGFCTRQNGHAGPCAVAYNR